MVQAHRCCSALAVVFGMDFAWVSHGLGVVLACLWHESVAVFCPGSSGSILPPAHIQVPE